MKTMYVFVICLFFVYNAICDCNEKGINTEIGCRCFTPYVGKNCTSTFQSCSSNSFFDTTNQKCICKDGFGGDDCDTCIKVCFLNSLIIFFLKRVHKVIQIYFLFVLEQKEEMDHINYLH